MSRRSDSDESPFSSAPHGVVAWRPDQNDVTTWLEEAEVDLNGLIPWGSNYTFLVTLQHPTAGCSYAIYKPQRGETPLYDFPEGSLFRRERAAYIVSEALGWTIVPPTVIRDGPYGAGMVQLFIDCDTNAHYFTFGAQIADEARRIALFDCIINNADRKAGHLLLTPDQRVWAIDHGLTFHSAPKLRTVIWDFAGEPFPRSLQRDLKKLLAGFDDHAGPLKELHTLLNTREQEALRYRTERLIAEGAYPEPTSYRSMPWPAV